MLEFRVELSGVPEMKERAEFLERNRAHGHFLRVLFGIVEDGLLPCA